VTGKTTESSCFSTGTIAAGLNDTVLDGRRALDMLLYVLFLDATTDLRPISD
jgi:hypothetical protein